MGVYVLMATAGLVFSAWAWDRLTQAGPPQWGHPVGSSANEVPPAILLGAVLGVVVGAKLGFVLAELGPLLQRPFADIWPTLIQGKTVTGGLLGGYAGVEIAKHAIGHEQATGDTFALIIPASLLFGRSGCLAAGCCPGIVMARSWYTFTGPGGLPRWPAVSVEILFNLLFLVWAWSHGRRRTQLRGQLFHVYLVSYGLFRIGHEWLRDTPRLFGSWTGYQGLALAMVVLGVVRFVQRHRDKSVPGQSSQTTASHAAPPPTA